MRKKKIIAFTTSLVLLAALATFLRYPEPRIQPKAVGRLSSEDVSAISNAVRHRMWHDAFNDFSWKTIKALPGAIKRNVTTRVEIAAQPSGMIMAFATSNGSRQISSGTSCSFYSLKQGSEGWTCEGVFVITVP